ncbi:enoyl-CoA hydratase/isomerase family protein [Actinomadura sp. SCN-SB]|uniref:enoyl-CoA hydratase/isomerase family protein n=1 Tax=Actinomadura sp. SCN-SB TaxID=3373092 RepID=UPI0037518BA2
MGTPGQEAREIAYRKHDGIAQITLDRPASLNPISARPGGTRDQIRRALDDAEADPSIGAVLLNGAGRSFSAGGDLAGNAPRESAAEEFRFQERADRFHDRIRRSPLPIVAAVHGHCLGAGLVLAACCDLVIAGTGARIGMPEGRLGLAGASALVPLVGRQWAKFLILTGELIDAALACRIGLVTAVVPDEELAGRSLDLARRLSRMPREATTLNKRAVDAVAEASGDAAGRVAARAHDALTLAMSGLAAAPDGRSFAEIRKSEGVQGLKAARDAQYTEPWLRP